MSILKIRILSGFITLVAPRSAWGQSKRDLSVRVLNTKSGRALTNAGMDRPDGSILHIQKTIDDGVTTISRPRKRGPFVNSFELGICSVDFHPIDQILMAGEVSEDDCGKSEI